MKWALVTAIAVVLAVGQAAAEEKVLYCIDTGNYGFVWENDTVKPQLFKQRRYVVKVHANGDRTIGDVRHTCSLVWPNIGDKTLSCTRSQNSGTEPWVFFGNNFTRAFLLGKNVDGDPNISVAYGTCTDF
jgi:hypothetical protein